MNCIRHEFENPGAEHRSLPFYALNDALEPDAVRRQVRAMADMGMGGFFLHAREGLETEYLGEKWFETLDAAVDEAEKRGVKAWLYDEDRFPSGGAGGRVVEADPERFGARALTWDGETARVEKAAPCGWYNDNPPSDNLNPDAVKTYIRLTHDLYKARYGNRTGGIFTDEPNVADFRASYTPGRKWVPWTEGFETYFRNLYGYDLLPRARALFEGGLGSERVRHDYWRAVSLRFDEAYFGQIEDAGLALTGHCMAENELAHSVRMSGGVMPHYRHMAIPGIDLLAEQTDELFTAKQVSSISNQLGRRAICEAFGCTGWDFSFAARRWIGDWLLAMGVDLRCPHHALYSLRGCRKRDYPPSFNENGGAAGWTKPVEDYFARLTSALSGGRAMRDALVIHPLTSAFCMLGGGYCADYVWHADDGDADILQARVEKDVRALLSRHVDFDFGDEATLARCGGVRDGKLAVGQANYTCVILPSLVNLETPTLALLNAFLDAGGLVIVEGDAPRLLDGAPDPKLDAFLARCERAGDPETLAARAMSFCKPAFEGDARLVGVAKAFPDRVCVFVSNNDRENAHDMRLLVPGRVELWDALTGEIVLDCGRVRTLAAETSALFMIYPETAQTDKTALESDASRTDARIRLRPTLIGFARDMPNALPLDMCRVRVDGGSESEITPLWKWQKNFRAERGMICTYPNGSAQRYRWVGKPHPGDGARVTLSFPFEARAYVGSIKLALETPSQYEIALNGERVPNVPDGYYFDRAFETVPLPAPRVGANTLELTVAYRNATELEEPILLGDFAVYADRALCAEPKTIRVGDWCAQGYYHYAGSMAYFYRFDRPENARAYVRPFAFEGVGARIEVCDGSRAEASNGSRAEAGEGTAIDLPWRAETATELTGGGAFTVRVLGGMGNAFGPFHATGTQNIWVDWTFFSREGARDDPGYRVRARGLTEDIEIEIERGDAE